MALMKIIIGLNSLIALHINILGKKMYLRKVAYLMVHWR